MPEPVFETHIRTTRALQGTHDGRHAQAGPPAPWSAFIITTTRLLSCCCTWPQEDPERESPVYINSPGGHIDAGVAIYDTMHLIKPQAATSCIDMAASELAEAQGAFAVVTAH